MLRRVLVDGLRAVATVRRMLDTFDRRGVRLASGKRIAANADVVRYLIERVGEAAVSG